MLKLTQKKQIHFFIESNIVILQYNYIIMGATKTDFYTDNQNELAILAKALGHPARIAIIEYILKVNSCICGDIVNELPLAQPTVSQHLKELKNAGLIKGSVEGNAICYCIDENGFEKIKPFFENITVHLEKKKTNCC
jgi:ArsR family transcriptional regulator, arsenate/arsenite/antimonite-responsive transcriptional repressor